MVHREHQCILEEWKTYFGKLPRWFVKKDKNELRGDPYDHDLVGSVVVTPYSITPANNNNTALAEDAPAMRFALGIANNLGDHWDDPEWEEAPPAMGVKKAKGLPLNNSHTAADVAPWQI